MFASGSRWALAAGRRQLRARELPRIASTACGPTEAPPSPDSSPSAHRPRFFWASSRNMTNDAAADSAAREDRRRLLNRTLYRSRQRGYLELDLLLGKWATDHIDELDERHFGALVEVLEHENPDLLRWITGQSEAPEAIAKNPVFSAIHKEISERLAKYSSEETRARPGHDWVRGWDDNRRVGGPPAGNQ